MTVTADLVNPGAEDAQVTAALSLPPGIRQVSSNAAGSVHISATEGWSQLRWEIEAAEPMTADMVLELKAIDGSPVAHQSLRMLFLPPVEVSSPPDIPEPVPAPASVLVAHIIVRYGKRTSRRCG